MSLNVSAKTGRTTLLLSVGFVCAVLLLALRPIEAFDAFWQLQSGQR